MLGDRNVRTTHAFRSTGCWAAWMIGLFFPLLANAQSSSWPEFPNPGTTSSSSRTDQRPDLLPPPAPEPEFPQPDAPPGSLAHPPTRLSSHLTLLPAPQQGAPAVPVSSSWQTSNVPAPIDPPTARSSPPRSTAMPTSGLMPERAPKNFGQGWKSVMTHGPAELHKPSATLAAPKTNRTRPAGGWYGYDSYTSPGHPTTNELAKDLSAELAPFMKYAHRWRPSSMQTAFGRTSSGYAGVGEPVIPPVRYDVGSPSLTSAQPSVTVPVNDQGRPQNLLPAPDKPQTAGVTPIPAITVPVDPMGRPVIQPTDYRSPAPQVTTTSKYVVPLHDPQSANALPPGLQEKILATCQGKCRGLYAEVLGPGRLRIQFKAKDQLDAELLANLLSAMPELAPYRVEFEVQIGQ